MHESHDGTVSYDFMWFRWIGRCHGTVGLDVSWITESFGSAWARGWVARRSIPPWQAARLEIWNVHLSYPQLNRWKRALESTDDVPSNLRPCLLDRQGADLRARTDPSLPSLPSHGFFFDRGIHLGAIRFVSRLHHHHVSDTHQHQKTVQRPRLLRSFPLFSVRGPRRTCRGASPRLPFGSSSPCFPHEFGSRTDLEGSGPRRSVSEKPSRVGHSTWRERRTHVRDSPLPRRRRHAEIEVGNWRRKDEDVDERKEPEDADRRRHRRRKNLGTTARDVPKDAFVRVEGRLRQGGRRRGRLETSVRVPGAAFKWTCRCRNGSEAQRGRHRGRTLEAGTNGLRTAVPRVPLAHTVDLTHAERVWWARSTLRCRGRWGWWPQPCCLHRLLASIDHDGTLQSNWEHATATHTSPSCANGGSARTVGQLHAPASDVWEELRR